MAAYVGQASVYLKFESVSGWGNYLYLDNINVKYYPVSIGISEQLNPSDVSVYPNPANDVINIDLKAISLENTTIEMYDAIGKLVMNQKLSSVNSVVSIADLSKGIYTIRIIANGQQLVKRIIKE